MKLSIISLVSIVLLAGCSNSANTHANSPCAKDDTPPLPKKECYNDNHEVRPCDNFDAAGNVIGNGARYVYDESVNAWHWVSSEQMQERYRSAWEATKQAASKGWNAAKEQYNEHK